MTPKIGLKAFRYDRLPLLWMPPFESGSLASPAAPAVRDPALSDARESWSSFKNPTGI